MTIAEQIITGVITGLFASICFAFLQFVIRPKFKISTVMCYSETENGDKVLKVKVVNLTRSVLMDVKYTLRYYVDYEDGLSDVTEIPPRKTQLATMPKYTRKNKDYAVRFTYVWDQDKFPLENNRLVFSFQATHQISNTKKCKEVIYKKKDIKNANFQLGKSLDYLLKDSERGS